MKKLIFILTIAALSLGIQCKSSAQLIKVGGGAELRTDPPAAFFVKATYNLGFWDENIGTSIDLMLIPKLEANLDFHYSFLNDFGIRGYGLAGFNYRTYLGFNAGAGFMYNINDDFDAFGEVKYVIKNSPEASIKIGLLYYL